MSSLVSHLTPEQTAAVQHRDGPMLVLAGPGSGKTRVITHRIAQLIESGVRDHQILALTFTNKATREMDERVRKLLPDSRVEVSTFHRFCARTLRRNADAVGLKPNYTILDHAEQVSLIRRLVKDADFSSTYFEPSRIANKISRAKNEMIGPEDMLAQLRERIGDPMQQAVAEIYPLYQQALLNTNCVDFDDLLLHMVRMLTEWPAFREDLDHRFQYILVDEYQDTNLAQYRIVAAMSQVYPNLCATGDPDQWIYGWRGARVSNILSFQSDFPDTHVVKLDQNFRSTQSIVRVADELINHNKKRPKRSLHTNNAEGLAPKLLHYSTGEDEANGIIEQIKERVESGERKWSDYAIFYRVNALSRQFEIAMTQQQAPFQIASGFAFYDRAEIKDLLAWLRLIENPDDDSAFLRTVNSPPRGIGAKTLQHLRRFAEPRNLSLHAAAKKRREIPELPKRSMGAVGKFLKLIDELRDEASRLSVDGLLNSIIARSGYAEGLEASIHERDAQRRANIDELITATREFNEQNNEDTSLQAFLESASLVSDVDSVKNDAGCITLMTMHAAKGLEFPVVHIVGVEHNLIPHERALRDGSSTDLEEERRLLFVGMTRAEEELYLSQAFDRALHGTRRATIRSSFLDEVNLEVQDCTRGDKRRQQSGVPERLKRHPGKRPDGQPLLMTAADLLKGNRKEATVPGLYRIGMQVRHPRYGRGTVLELGGTPRRPTVSVQFESDDRCETFIADKAPLNPIG
ncbi:MAG: ATP-dependent helicase [Planctomycetaceae bacterium]